MVTFPDTDTVSFVHIRTYQDTFHCAPTVRNPTFPREWPAATIQDTCTVIQASSDTLALTASVIGDTSLTIQPGQIFDTGFQGHILPSTGKIEALTASCKTFGAQKFMDRSLASLLPYSRDADFAHSFSIPKN